MKHDVILADPPWLERGAGKSKRGADKHYRLMPTADIAALADRVQTLAAPDSFLFLWVTDNFLEDGLAVMKAWGYRYKRTFVWVKNKMGLGFYARGKHELCLLGVRGKPARSRRKPGNWGTDVPSVLHADRGQHSRKPDEFYEIVEAFGEKRLELFARRTRRGWTTIGDELGTTL